MRLCLYCCILWLRSCLAWGKFSVSAQGMEAGLDVQSSRHSCPHPALLQRLRPRHPELLRCGTLQATSSRARPNRSVAWLRLCSKGTIAHVLHCFMPLQWQSDALRCSLAAFAQGREVHRCQYGSSLLGLSQELSRSKSKSVVVSWQTRAFRHGQFLLYRSGTCSTQAEDPRPAFASANAKIYPSILPGLLRSYGHSAWSH